jgi:hypothetical protein
MGLPGPVAITRYGSDSIRMALYNMLTLYDQRMIDMKRCNIVPGSESRSSLRAMQYCTVGLLRETPLSH